MCGQFVPQTEEQLQAYLKSFGIPVELWGQGSAKTVGHLMQEIVEEETVLIERGSELLRQVGFVAVKVTYRDGRDVYELVENRQEFSDGRVRTRDTGSSVSEKIRLGETPRNAAERGLRDEIGITGCVNLEGPAESEEIKESPSYPGLRTQYLRYDFQVELNRGQFSPNGYIEEQEDKTTYFVWRKR